MWVEVAIGLLAISAIVFSWLSGHEAGYSKRAMEDKRSMIDAEVARFRAEQEAILYRRRALALLRAAAGPPP